MTLNAVAGMAAPKANTRSGEWGKSTQAEARGFDDALAGGTGKRKPANTDAQERAETVGSVWKAGSYGARLGLGVTAGPAEKIRGGIEELLPPADASELPVPEIEPDLTIDDAAALADAPVAAVAEQQVQSQAALPPADLIKAMLKELGGDQEPQNLDVAPDGDDPDAETGPIRIAERGPRDGGAGSERNPAANAPATPTSATGTGTGATESQAGRLGAAGAAAAGRVADASVQSRQTGDAVAPEQDRHPSGNRPQGEAARTATRITDEPGLQSRTSPATPPASSPNDALAAKVNVIGFSSALAPAPTATPLLGATAAGVVAAMEGEPSWRQAAAERALASGQRTPSSLAGVNTLRIQLHPAELGMVTARLTATGSQLSIEIQVESNDARQRLANDSDAILKALRGIGYDVEKVTIQQTSQGGQTQAQANGSGREQFLADQQARDEANTRGQGGQDTTGREREGSAHGHGETAAERSGGGVYI